VTSSGYLARLAARSVQPAEGVRPRPASAFEDRGPGRLGRLSDLGSTPRAIQGRGALADSGQGVGRTLEPMTSDSSTTPREGPSKEKSPVTLAPPAAQPFDVAAAGPPADDPDTSSSRPNASDPIESASPVGAGTLASASLHSGADIVPPRGHLPSRSSPPADRPGLEHSQVSERLDGEAPDNRTARAAELTPPLAATPSRLAPAGEGEDGRGAAPPSLAEMRGVADAVPDLPALAQETAPASATVSSVLPRIRATASEREQPTAAPEPPITVTIGRIEVLPPAPPQPSPVPSGHRRAPGAPDLGDYLRGRSGR
jgi:hypothetical protein